MTPLKVVDVLGWTLPTYQWGVFKREGTAIPDCSQPPGSSVIGARLWFWFTSVCSAARLHKQTDFEEGDEVQQQKCYNQSFRDASSRPVICSHLPPDQTQAELQNKHPSIQWGARVPGVAALTKTTLAPDGWSRAHAQHECSNDRGTWWRLYKAFE